MFSTNLIKGLLLAFAVLFLTACGGGAKTGGGAGRSTAPSEEQMHRLNEARASSEAAERNLHEKRLERIELERQLEERQ